MLTKGKCFEKQGHLQESLLCYEDALKQYTISNTAAKSLIGSNFQQKVILAQEIQQSLISVRDKINNLSMDHNDNQASGVISPTNAISQV